MIKAIVTGAAGRMGKSIIGNIADTENIDLSGATENNGSGSIGRDAGEVAGTGKNGVTISGSIQEVIGDGDVIIDFTAPEATMQHVEAAVRSKKGIVIGTTGLSDAQVSTIKNASKEIKIVFAPNMSVGVNVMWKMLGEMAKILGDDFDVEVIEAHHRLKKDAPSGTANRILEILCDSLGRDLKKDPIYERKGIIGERGKKEIGMQTIRAGDIVGDHTVIFGGQGERLELTHKASNRDNFAKGAVRAAIWLEDKGPGLFDMQDVLGLN
ncbi:MAG: 4-hydroxy-tetrahydrodipicolinate reductase [Nitrospinota bacterium]